MDDPTGDVERGEGGGVGRGVGGTYSELGGLHLL